MSTLGWQARERRDLNAMVSELVFREPAPAELPNPDATEIQFSPKRSWVSARTADGTRWEPRDFCTDLVSLHRMEMELVGRQLSEAYATVLVRRLFPQHQPPYPADQVAACLMVADGEIRCRAAVEVCTRPGTLGRVPTAPARAPNWLARLEHIFPAR